MCAHYHHSKFALSGSSIHVHVCVHNAVDCWVFTLVVLHLVRYYTAEFKWDQDVVTVRQREPLSKFDKWWISKNMCIEGTHT